MISILEREQQEMPENPVTGINQQTQHKTGCIYHNLIHKFVLQRAPSSTVSNL